MVPELLFIILGLVPELRVDASKFGKDTTHKKSYSTRACQVYVMNLTTS